MVALFIDFENVRSEAFKGAEHLLNTDSVYLFYSDACPNLTIQNYNHIKNSGCNFKAIKLVRPGSNFLDMYIASACGELIGNGYDGDIVIISRDKGFQSVVDYWENHEKYKRKIIKASNIGAAFLLTQDKEGKLRRRILMNNDRKVSISEEYAKYKVKRELEEKITNCFIGTAYEEYLPEIKQLINGENELNLKKELYLNFF